MECVSLNAERGPGPVMMTVYTARSLDGWGTPRNTLDLHMLMESVREMLKLRFSLNFYMFHGGTNFGFTGGAAFPGHRLPMVTSYDYGALLTEDGGYTPEYLVFQEFFRPDAGVPSFQHQDHRPKDTYAPLAAGHFISLWDTLIHQDDEPVRSTGPLSMEQLSVNEGSGQSAGYILYETVITRGGVLNSDGHVKDRGQVFLDDKYIGVLDDTHQKLTLPSDHYKEFLTLRILVENQGRLASGTSMNQERKGLTGNIYLNGSPLRKFKIYSLEMQNKFIQRKLPNIWKPSFLHTVGPAFFLALLRVGSQPKDTFMSLQGWTKGVVFINGQNLGRYWNVGPQETLYVPGPWLKPGLNEIIVFEEFKSTLLIYFTNTSQLGY